MKFAKYIKTAELIFLRLADIFLIWPSVTVGVLILFAGVTSNQPARDIVSIAYEWGDERFRNAPVNSIFIPIYEKHDWEESKSSEILPVLPAEIKIIGVETVETQKAIEKGAQLLTEIYWILVLLCSSLMLLSIGPVRFFGLSEIFRKEL